MELSTGQIAEMLGGTLIGNAEAPVYTISNIEEASKGAISFLSNQKYEPHLYTTEASAVIVSKDFVPKQDPDTTLIQVDDPYASFTLLLEEYQKLLSFQKSGIESPSYIDTTATYGDQVYVGAFSYLGEKVRLGNNVKIYPNCYIGDKVEISDNTIVHAGVKIYPNTSIGNHCVIHSGAVIGSDGFGFAPQRDGTYKKIPQLGRVIIEDHVDIGANTVIDCATFEATTIKSGVKLDNLIQVAHNAEIGENTVVAAQAGISGSTKVGRNCIIGGQAGIVGHIKVADGTKIQAQSGVIKATKENTAIYGSPAFEYNGYIRSYAVFKKLPEVMKRVQALEEKILNL
ncbi:MAG: UDP-3-O-(3-hydroxymyristoyl)glucosamine N-acyltransferase [Cyclobacteriaceae bacterium]|nr:UDP-3-O-(3-hydroxymyristoyl)glucosamine N-acyltransferase [Cyclobacteriaceae bacterium HetDA_MAG_MS6]